MILKKTAKEAAAAKPETGEVYRADTCFGWQFTPEEETAVFLRQSGAAVQKLQNHPVRGWEAP